MGAGWQPGQPMIGPADDCADGTLEDGQDADRLAVDQRLKRIRGRQRAGGGPAEAQQRPSRGPQVPLVRPAWLENAGASSSPTHPRRRPSGESRGRTDNDGSKQTVSPARGGMDVQQRQYGGASCNAPAGCRMRDRTRGSRDRGSRMSGLPHPVTPRRVQLLGAQDPGPRTQDTVGHMAKEPPILALAGAPRLSIIPH